MALAVNRALAAGGRAWRSRAASDPLDAGDYLVELTASRRTAIADLGLKVATVGSRHPAAAQASEAPRPHCCSRAPRSRFPYYAYYALCLLRLGVAYTPCDGATLSTAHWTTPIC